VSCFSSPTQAKRCESHLNQPNISSPRVTLVKPDAAYFSTAETAKEITGITGRMTVALKARNRLSNQSLIGFSLRAGISLSLYYLELKDCVKIENKGKKTQPLKFTPNILGWDTRIKNMWRRHEICPLLLQWHTLSSL